MIVDTNVTLSRWPFRRLQGDEPARLVSMLRERGIGQAWASSFDGLLHKDVAGVNSRLAEDCRNYGAGLLVPFGTVNPTLPDWKDDLRRCHEVHHMPGIRLYPNYHAYKLSDPVFAELIGGAVARRLIVQLVWCMEDERTQHPLLRVPNVDLSPLPDLLRRIPKLRLVILNCRRTVTGDWEAAEGDETQHLVDAGEVYFDFAMVETPGGVEQLRRKVSTEQVVFGSNAPLYYVEAAVLKVREAGLTAADEQAITERNAARLLLARDTR